MELAPTTALGTITWKESDLNDEALVFRQRLLECITPDPGWLDPGDRPHITLRLDDTPIQVQAGCMNIFHGTVFMVVGIPVNSPAPTHFLGLVKSRGFKWTLHDQCVILSEGDVQDVQDLANHALTLLLGTQR